MGCVLSTRQIDGKQEKNDRRKRPESAAALAGKTCEGDACYFNGIEKNDRKLFDSSELRPPVPVKSTGSGKVPEIGSMLGRASIASIEKAVQVLDTLGSSMSSLNPSSGFVAGITVRGNKVSILAFEVANTIAKGANLLRSLSDENIQFLKKDILQSDGVRNLVSDDTSELLGIAAQDKRDELHVFSSEVIRFGDLCKDPVWHNLGRYFQRLDADPTPQEQIKEDTEETLHQLINLAQNTSELYHELHALDRYEQEYRLKLQEEELLPAARREHLMMLNNDLKQQRKLVKSLKKRSLWSRSLEEVVEKLVDIVILLHNKIVDEFGATGLSVKSDEDGIVNNQRLGVTGLALHYANIINQIDNIVSRPLSLPPNTRDSLYHGLPTGVKSSFRSRLQSFDVKAEYNVTQIKAEMQKTLSWIVPLAENTIRAHQGFGWVGEWANLGTEINKKPGPHNGIIRLQTLYHADKEKTEEYILQLVVWLHHLVTQVKNRGYGFKSMKPIRSQSTKGAFSKRKSEQSQPTASLEKLAKTPPLSEDEMKLLGNAISSKVILRRSKSTSSLFRKARTVSNTRGQRRSYANSPGSDLRVNSDLQQERTKVLDVMDGLDTPELLPALSFCI